MKTDTSAFTAILQAHNVSVTATRIAIFTTLLHADAPLKNGEIAKRTPSVDRASVYRNLELFATLGITITTIRGWTPLTELAEPFKSHHHHIICEECGAIEEIESNTLEDVLGIIASRHNYSLKKHIVELTGVCKQCNDSHTSKNAS